MLGIRPAPPTIVLAVLVGLLARAGPAGAAEPTGEWLVEGGEAKVRIEKCAGEIWGLISWEKEPGTSDKSNPDPARRSRPTLGMPVLLGMKQTASNRWDGDIYNAMNGKTYAANISLAAADHLRVEGCVLGLLCGGETWTRVPMMAKPDAIAGSRPRGALFGSAKDVCKAAASATGKPALADETLARPAR